MELKLPIEVAKNYSSRSQQIRIMTESWVNNSIFCPNCGYRISSFENNRPVADFYCERCSEEYELKSKHGTIGEKIVDGAYSTMINRLNANNNPNFFFLTYDKSSYEVNNFLTIPKYFFITNIIEKRKPLIITARRAGWVGCNIILSSIPEFGKIFYIQNGIPNSKHEILSNWNRTGFLKKTYDIEARGWLLDVFMCVDSLKKKEFSLEEIYRFEEHLKTKHPSNNNVLAKIRQQLQLLRDKHVIDFVSPGIYRLKEC